MLDRRNVLKTLTCPILATRLLQSWGNEYQAKENRRPRVAIHTSFAYRSHVVILELSTTVSFCGEVTDPGRGCRFRDQTPLEI